MVTIGELLQARSDTWKLKLIAGESGLANAVSIPRIQKPGLALAGYLPQIHPERVQVIGRTELGYLATLADDVAQRAVDRMLAERVACVVVTNGAVPPSYFEESARRHRVPLVITELKSSELIRNVTAWLEDRLAPHTLIHGVLVEVFGLGVLLLGKSGIGKSEAALDLVARGMTAEALQHVVPRGDLDDGRDAASRPNRNPHLRQHDPEDRVHLVLEPEPVGALFLAPVEHLGDQLDRLLP